ncbi:MAG: hypothetical protein ACPG7F_05840, partial [Aggregatilineales bacterium]
TKKRTFIKNGVIERAFMWQPYAVAGQAALSLSIRSIVKYNRNVQQFINDNTGATKDVIGMRVIDKNNPAMDGTILSLTGTIADHRDALLAHIPDEQSRKNLLAAGDEELVFEMQSGAYTHFYAARDLHILIENAADYARFGISQKQAATASALRPDVRAGMMKLLSDVLKSEDIIGSSYNSRSHDNLFAQIDFLPGIEFGSRRVKPYNNALHDHFLQEGVFWQDPRFTEGAVRIAVINTLDEKVDDFIEAMRRQLESNFGYQIEIIRKRRVRVMNRKNLESAVRAVRADEKKAPHVVLAFFADDDGSNSDAYLRSLTLAKGIASQAVFATTMHDPDAMPRLIMGMLAKTGNIPYALAEPLEYTDFVVGLDIVRESLTRGDRVVAIARIYRNNGEFLAYIMDTIELDAGDPIPFVLMQTLFPQEDFAEKRIIIHHDGSINADMLRLLTRWQAVLGSEFHPIEIVRESVPYLYALRDGISAPEYGSIFQLDADNLLVVADPAQRDHLTAPLHIHCHSDLGIGQAAYSVLAWTLLHYGTRNQHLPVSIKHAQDIGQWLARGILPENTHGDVPFWL